LVEHQLPKLRVVGSSPIARSIGRKPKPAREAGFALQWPTGSAPTAG
jgi:hypothetical protein